MDTIINRMSDIFVKKDDCSKRLQEETQIEGKIWGSIREQGVKIDTTTRIVWWFMGIISAVMVSMLGVFIKLSTDIISKLG